MTICPPEGLSIPIFKDYHFYFCLPVLQFMLMVMNVKSFIQISKVYSVPLGTLASGQNVGTVTHCIFIVMS